MSECKRLHSLNEVKKGQIKLLQEKLIIRDQLTKKAQKYKSLKTKHTMETKALRRKLEETQKEKKKTVFNEI